MSDYTAVADVTNTILNVLKIESDTLLLPDRIGAGSPADVSDDTVPSLSLFLYQVAEDQHRKNQVMQEAADGSLRFPPLALTLHYLLTAYAGNRDVEQQILGRALQILHDHAVLRGSLLQGSLAGGFDEIVIVMVPMSIDDLNKLWSLFGGKPYRLSVAYQASALIDSSRQSPADRVVSRTVRIQAP